MSTFIRRYLLLTILILAFSNAHARSFNTIASGNFSNPATWLAGTVPPAILNGADTIVINSGHNVVLNQNLFFFPNKWMLNVAGNLTSTANNYIWMYGIGTFLISGTCHIDSVHISQAVLADISGQMTVNKIHCGVLSVTGTGTFNFAQRAYIYSGVQNTDGGNINFLDNVTIFMRGGGVSKGINGGIINMAPLTYDVIYSHLSHKWPTGLELTGTGLRNVLIDIDDTTNLKLGADFTMTNNGVLTLKRGSLVLNSYKLKFLMNSTLAGSGTGRIKSSAPSKVIINNNGIGSPLRFAPGAQLDSLVQNTTNSTTTKLATNLLITKSVNMVNGKIEVMDTCILSMAAGASISGADTGSYVITTATGCVAANIDSGKSFTYHIGTANNYAPCAVIPNNDNTSRELKARINPGVKKMGTTGSNLASTTSVVDATWFLEHDTATNIDINVELSWDTTMEAGGFDRNMAYISNFRTSNWDTALGKSSTAGQYGLFAIKRNSIKSLGLFAVFDNNTVGIGDIAPNKHVGIYPNPAANILHVDILRPVRAVIYNSTGLMIVAHNIDKNNDTIDISSLSPGMYYIQFSGQNINATEKFMKL